MNINLVAAVTSISNHRVVLNTQYINLIKKPVFNSNNIGFSAEKWNGYATSDAILLSNKVTIGSATVNNNNTLTVVEDITFNQNLEGAWNSSSLPDCPDDGSATVYKSNFDDLIKYTFSGMTESVSFSVLSTTLTNTTANYTTYDIFGTNQRFRIKTRKTSGRQTTFKLELYLDDNWVTVVNDSDYYNTSDWKIFDYDFTEALTGVRVSFPSNAEPWLTTTDYSIGDYVIENSVFYVCIEAHTSGTFLDDLGDNLWQIDTNTIETEFIYSGGGNYSSPFTDLSRNKFNGRIVGCTPVSGVSDKALKFNTINDAITFDKTVSNQNQTISFWLKIDSEDEFTIMGCEDTSKESFIAASARDLLISLSDGVGIKSESISDYFLIDDKYHFYAIIFNESYISAFRDSTLIYTISDDFTDYILSINKIGNINV